MSEGRSAAELRAGSRLIHGHGEASVADTLSALAAWCQDTGVAFDEYGAGDLVQRFEGEVAELLGYPAARFMPSGTMAQQIALRVWADRAGTNAIAMHPTSHLELHEERGYSRLHRLDATLAGPIHSPMLAEHLSPVAGPLAAVLVELPTREAGGLLPSWGELEDIKVAVRRRGARLHLDGARLWECGPAYGRSYAEICDGFDSAYVSFYKGIGALPGAMLLGTREFIAEAAVWQRRGGGSLYTVTPNVASAAMLLRQRLSRMPAYLERARRLAGVLSGIPGVTVKPDPPHVNMFHVFFDVGPQAAIDARNRVAREHGIWAFGWVASTEIPNHCRTEIYIGEAAMSVVDEDVERAFRSLMSETSLPHARHREEELS